MSGLAHRLWRRATDSVQDYIHSVRTALHPPPSRTLFAFNDQADVDHFQVTTDTVLGGHSTCVFTLEPCGQGGEPAGVFQGVIEAPDYDGRTNKGGFASFRTKPFDKSWNLDAFQALQMTVRTDGRPYIVNLKCADHHPENLFQGRIVVPAQQWVTVALSFESFVLTSRGTVSLNQVPVSSECINGFGVLLADGKDGPFRFEVQNVMALRDFDDGEYVNVAPRVKAEALQAGRRAPAGTPTPPSASAAAPGSDADSDTAASLHRGQQAPGSGKPAAKAWSAANDEEYEERRRAARV